MTLEVFVSVLVISATATSLCIEMIKKLLNAFGKEYKTMPLSVIIAFMVGVAEIIIYTVSNGVSVTMMTMLYAICMGIANAIGATTSYDTVKKFIYALFGK